ncbi:hypothetical protein V8E54_012059 [Elaphomyces granulatus]
MTLLPLGFRHPAASEAEVQVASAGFVGPISDLALWRQCLFQLNEGETVTPTGEQWQYYWPFMSNVWTRSNAYTAQKRKQTSRTHWICRLCKSKAETSLGGGQRNRQHDIRSDICIFSMDGRHSHTLAFLDSMMALDRGLKPKFCRVFLQLQL